MTDRTTEQLYRDLYESLRGFVVRRVASEHDADDIVQEVFARIHAKSHELESIESVSGWMYRIARNAIIDHHRATAAAQRAAARFVHEPVEGAHERDGVMEATRCLSRSLEGFVQELSPEQREALTLTDLGGHTQREVAEQLGLSLSCVKSRVQRGRARLGVLLRECCDIELDARQGVMGFERRQGQDIC